MVIKVDFCEEVCEMDVIYQTQKTVFDHISKHREESWKYDT